jgi:competence protein ComEA
VPENVSLPRNEVTKRNSIIVEISGETDRKGIYFLPSEQLTIDDLCTAADIFKKREWKRELLDTSIISGDRIVIGRDYPYIKLEKIDAKTRLALDMPININSANVEELMLIPGIGCKTASAIIERRKALNGFSKLEDLIKMSGFGIKKFNRVKDYIYIEDGV